VTPVRCSRAESDAADHAGAVNSNQNCGLDAEAEITIRRTADRADHAALRGPARSNQPPQTLPSSPGRRRTGVHPARSTPSVAWVRTSRPEADSGPHLMEVLHPQRSDNGSQKTRSRRPFPIQRWIANAGGRNLQRLKPGDAMMPFFGEEAALTRGGQGREVRQCPMNVWVVSDAKGAAVL